MSRIIFDIETIGVDFEKMPPEMQKHVLKSEEDEQKIQEAKDKLGLSPLTGEIAAISLMNPDTGKGRTYFQSPGQTIESFVEGDMEYQSLPEKEILEKFWQEIKNCQPFITFNGRRFDCPYIMLRSAALKVRPTRNLAPYRYSAEEHIDLLDQLTFYDAFRRFSLDFYCQAFALKSGKLTGMSGDKVQEYFQQGDYLTIARYCSQDVKATAELLERWEKYIRI